MASSAPDTTPEAVPVSNDLPVIIRPEVIARYDAMVRDIPEAGGDGFDGILTALASAESVADLDAPWRSTGLEKLRNRTIRVDGIRKMPSDYPGGLPWFLVIDGWDVLTGQAITVTTGAVAVVAQLLNAYRLAGLPLTVIPRVAERPSKSGYYPVHLEIAA